MNLQHVNNYFLDTFGVLGLEDYPTNAVNFGSTETANVFNVFTVHNIMRLILNLQGGRQLNINLETTEFKLSVVLYLHNLACSSPLYTLERYFLQLIKIFHVKAN